MPRLVKEIVVARAPEAVFACLVEPGHRRAWSRTFEEGPVEGGLRVGARIPAKRRGSTSGSRYELVVTALDPPRRFAVDVVRNGKPAGSGAFELEPAAGGTRVRNAAEFSLSGLQRMMEPVVAATMTKEMENELAALKRHAESLAP